MNNKFLTKELIEQFKKYRNCIYYSPFNFEELYNKNFELQTFSRTYLTKFNYKQSQKNLTNEQIKEKVNIAFCNKDFKIHRDLGNNLILTNNKYPYISTNNYPMFIIWDFNNKASIHEIQKIIEQYFYKYDYLYIFHDN